MTSELTLIVRLTAKPDHNEVLSEHLITLAGLTAKEAGSLSYIVHRDNNDENGFIIYEKWTSPAALELHFAQPYMTEFMATAPSLLAQDAEMTYATALN